MNLALLLLAPAALAGAAALLLELAWLQRAGASLPGTAPAASVVLPAILLAWALGSFVAGRRADAPAARLARASRWLLLAAVGVLLAPLALAAAGDVVVSASAWVRALVGGLPAAPAAFALGGVLPWFTRLRAEQGRGPLAATAGCAAAVALGGGAAAWALLPLLRAGHDPLQLAAMLLALAALITWGLGALSAASAPAPAALSSEPGATPETEASGGPSPEPTPGELLRWRMLLVLGGAVLIGGQVLLLRVLAQTHGDNLSSTAALLAAVHLGMGGGALMLGATSRWRVTSRALPLLAFAALGLCGPALGLQQPWRAVLLAGLLLGLGAGCLLSACADLRPRADALGRWIGDLGAASTLGGVLGGVVTGQMLLTADGPGSAATLRFAPLLLVLAAAPFVFAGGVGRWRRALLAAPLLLVGAGAASAWVTPWEAPWRAAPDDVELVLRREGAHGIVNLVRRADGTTRLSVDGRFGLGGDGAGALLEQRLGRVAAALAPRARTALALGVGRGHSLAGLASTTAAEVTAVERNADVLALGLPFPALMGSSFPPVAPRVLHADARAHIAAASAEYDLIVGDLFHPSALGAGALLSREHFAAVRAALREEGVYVQWLPLHQLSWEAFGTVARAYLEVFPTTRVLYATSLADTPLVALVGGLGAGLPASSAIDATLGSTRCAAGPNSAEELYDLVLCDAWALQRALGEGPSNTLATPWSEWLSQGRLDQEDALATTNLRRLALLSSPLSTSSLGAPPDDDAERRLLGRELAARSTLREALLHARADRALLASPELGEGALERRIDVERQLHARLLGSWATLPGHADARAALLERGGELARERRVSEAAALLGGALRAGGDAALGAGLGRMLLRLGRDADALGVLEQAIAMAPEEPSLQLDLAAALILTGEPALALSALGRASVLISPTELPVPAQLASALLRGEAAAQIPAETVRAGLAPDSPWGRALGVLLGARG